MKRLLYLILKKDMIKNNNFGTSKNSKAEVNKNELKEILESNPYDESLYSKKTKEELIQEEKEHEALIKNDLNYNNESGVVYARSNDSSRGYGLVTDAGVVFSAYDLNKTVYATSEGVETIMNQPTIPFSYQSGNYLYWETIDSDILRGEKAFIPSGYVKKQSIDLPIAYLDDMVRDNRTISDERFYFTSSIDGYSGEPTWSHQYGKLQPMDGTWIIATDGTSATRIDQVGAISGLYQNKLYYEDFEGECLSYDLISQFIKPDVQFRWVVDGKIYGTELDQIVDGKVGFVTNDCLIYFKEGSWHFETNLNPWF